MRSRTVKTNFKGGVLSPDAIAREETPEYNNSLLAGENVIVETMGGLSRRAGTLFIKDYGAQEIVRILPFMFNIDQKYLIVFTIDEIEIFHDGVSVS